MVRSVQKKYSLPFSSSSFGPSPLTTPPHSHARSLTHSLTHSDPQPQTLLGRGTASWDRAKGCKTALVSQMQITDIIKGL